MLLKGHDYHVRKLDGQWKMDAWMRPTQIYTKNGELKTEITGRVRPEADIQIRLNGVRYGAVKALRSGTTDEWWTAPITVRPGEYIIKAEAYHRHVPGAARAGEYKRFSVGIQPRIFTYKYDSEGNLTEKLVEGTANSIAPMYLAMAKDPWGGDYKILHHLNNNHTIQYTWDAWGRLLKVARKERHVNKKGYQWSATYDSLGRRLKTVYTPVVGDVPVHEKSETILSYYDPEVEFLEIGVKVNEQVTTWKAYGVDKDGTYGGLQGIGGLEVIMAPNPTLHGVVIGERARYTPTIAHDVIHDALGHAMATYDGGSEIKLIPGQAGAYGPLPGRLPLFLSSERERSLESVINWLGKRMDETGLYYLGKRYYDPENTRFISPDPFGHFGSLDLHSYANNDPVNFCDPTGRYGKQAFNVVAANVSTAGIPISMGLGGAGAAANAAGFNTVGNQLRTASGNTLQFVANRWDAANQGPMGRVIDRQIHASTSLLKPAIGQHNQQFLANWLTGNAPASVTYGGDSIQAQDMQSSLNMNRQRDQFYAGNTETQTDLNYDTIKAYAETILNPLTANWKSTAMQVGGYRGASITNNNDGTATYNIRNVAGANSFFLHMVPNLPGKTGPMHNVEQIFKWTERIDQNRLPRN